MCYQADVELEADTWADLWNASVAHHSVVDLDNSPQLTISSTTSIRTAVATFPVGTRLGSDNVPQCRLSDALFEALGRIFRSSEFAWGVGQVFSRSFIVLLD